jgi:hypothetical protein
VKMNLNLLTEPELFARLAEQGPAILLPHEKGASGVAVSGPRCQYRTPEGAKYGGRKCAVGMMIPDDVYDPTFEGLGLVEVLQLLVDYDLDEDANSDDGEHPDLNWLISAQEAHDDAAMNFTRAIRQEPWVNYLAAAWDDAGLEREPLR